MYGVNLGTLNVYTRPNNLQGSAQLQFTMSGNQGQQWLSASFQRSMDTSTRVSHSPGSASCASSCSVISTPLCWTSSCCFQVVFEAVRGDEYASDIAVDNIKVTDCGGGSGWYTAGGANEGSVDFRLHVFAGGDSSTSSSVPTTASTTTVTSGGGGSTGTFLTAWVPNYSSQSHAMTLQTSCHSTALSTMSMITAALSKKQVIMMTGLSLPQPHLPARQVPTLARVAPLVSSTMKPQTRTLGRELGKSCGTSPSMLHQRLHEVPFCRFSLPALVSSGTVSCAEVGFYYYMYGNDLGTLNVYTREGSNQANAALQFNISGNQGETWLYKSFQTAMSSTTRVCELQHYSCMPCLTLW